MVAELVHRPQGPGPASLAKGTTWHSEPGLAMTGSGPGLARPAGSTLAAKHPCKRVKAKEPGRAEVEAAKAKEAEAKAEDSPRNRARQLRSRRLPHRPSLLLLLLHRQLPSSLQHLPLTAPVAHPRKRHPGEGTACEQAEAEGDATGGAAEGEGGGGEGQGGDPWSDEGDSEAAAAPSREGWQDLQVYCLFLKGSGVWVSILKGAGVWGLRLQTFESKTLKL